MELSNEDIQKHSGMVHQLANKRWRQVRDPSIAFEDLVSEANIGLMQAYERFEPEKGFAFSTFAFRTIDGLLQRFLNLRDGTVRFPNHTIYLAGQIRKQGLEELKRDQIARQLDVSVDAVDQAFAYWQARHVVHLDRPIDESDPDATLEHLAKTHDDQSEIMANEFLNTLKPKHRQVVELKMQGLLNADVARHIGMSSERVRQILLRVQEQYKIIESKGMRGMGALAKTGPDSGVTKQIMLDKMAAGKSARDVELEYGMKLNTLPYWIKKWGAGRRHTETGAAADQWTAAGTRRN